MKLRNRLVLGFGAVIISSALAIWMHHRDSYSTALDPITIGLLAPLSGNWAELGVQVMRGASLAEQEANQKGGVLGRPIHLEIQDSNESVSPAQLLKVYRQLRARGISLFIGPTGTPGGIALAPLAAQEDVLMISPGVGIHHAFTSAARNTFNIQGGWEIGTRKIAAFAYADGVRRIAVFSSRHPFETKQADAFQEAFVAAGGLVNKRVDPAPEAENILPEVTSIIEAKPEAVFISNYNQLGLVARKLRELGFSGKLFTVQLDPSRLVDAHGSLEGTVFSQLSKMNESFKQAFRKKYNEDPQYLSDYAYDGLSVLLAAIQQIKSVEPSRLAGAIHELKREGASGNFSFDDEGEAVRTPTLWQLANGRLEPIEHY